MGIITNVKKNLNMMIYRTKKRCHLLVNLIYKEYDLILNDEKYFLYGDNYPGNDRYYTDDKDKCPLRQC